MDPLTTRLLDLLPTYGPEFLFVLAVLETSFVTGLVVPSGVATSLATVLALEGELDLASVWLAALAGGAAGDSLGFWVGRLWGKSLMEGHGRFAAAFRARNEKVAPHLRRHPLYSVTAARLISFVRTLMPMGAGMSGMRYRTFLPFALAGVVGWVLLYAGIGALARESWELVTHLVGIGGAVAFTLVGTVMWVVWRRRATSARARLAAPEGGPLVAASEADSPAAPGAQYARPTPDADAAAAAQRSPDSARAERRADR